MMTRQEYADKVYDAIRLLETLRDFAEYRESCYIAIPELEKIWAKLKEIK